MGFRSEPNVRILYMDDDERDIEAIIENLGYVGFQNVKVVRDGDNAMNLVQSFKAHLAIIAKMEHHSGYGICKKMKQTYGSRIQIIGTSDGLDGDKWKEHRADYFLKKYELSLGKQDLVETIKRILKK